MKIRKGSKRVSLHHKYKVEKKVKEHRRKLRKEAKKAALSGGSKLKKDPGIPNLWPMKEEFLQKIQEKKEKLEEEKQRQKEARQKELKKRRKQALKEAQGGDADIADIAVQAALKSKEFEKRMKGKQEEGEWEPSSLNIKDGSKKAYFREFKKIVESADVILEVLDARDPLGCRCPDIERKILAKYPNKKIILVLNKIDLVPRSNVEGWLKYLRNEFPSIGFKCSTQSQRKHLGQSTHNIKDGSQSILESSESLGADTLVQLLKNYARNLNLKTSINVGIIGYPNVGKSSLINSLKRSKAVGVGATPGFTKTAQEIHLDKNIKLLDSPGIVFSSSKNADNDIILRNCVKVEQIPDPIEPVETIIQRCKKEQLVDLYRIPNFETVNEFLIHIAHKTGKLGKGGKPDLKAAARGVLQDWNGGRIPFFTEPPKVKNVHIGASIVASWSKEFDIESVINEENKTFSSLANQSSEHFPMAPGKMDETEMLEEGKEEESDMEDDDESGSEEEEGSEEESEGEEESLEEMNDDDESVPVVTKAEVTQGKKARKQTMLTEEEEQLNPMVNKNLKKQLKKQKKLRKKNDPSMEDDDIAFAEFKEQQQKEKSKLKKVSDEAYDFNEFLDGIEEDED